jgi:glutamate synthase domain-containing protein 1
MKENELQMSEEPVDQRGNGRLQKRGLPPAQGLYNPAYERDACGMGFVVNIKGHKSHEIVQQGLTVLNNMTHRGASGSEVNTGDGAGIMLQIPHTFLQKVTTGFVLPKLVPTASGCFSFHTIPFSDSRPAACRADYC